MFLSAHKIMACQSHSVMFGRIQCVVFYGLYSVNTAHPQFPWVTASACIVGFGEFK